MTRASYRSRCQPFCCCAEIARHGRGLHGIEYPAQMIDPGHGEVMWLLDRPAASLLSAALLGS